MFLASLYITEIVNTLKSVHHYELSAKQKLAEFIELVERLVLECVFGFVCICSREEFQTYSTKLLTHFVKRVFYLVILVTVILNKYFSTNSLTLAVHANGEICCSVDIENFYINGC